MADSHGRSWDSAGSSRRRWDGEWRTNAEENKRKRHTPAHSEADARTKKLVETIKELRSELNASEVGRGTKKENKSEDREQFSAMLGSREGNGADHKRSPGGAHRFRGGV